MGHASIATTDIYLHHLGTGGRPNRPRPPEQRGNTWGTRSGRIKHASDEA